MLLLGGERSIRGFVSGNIEELSISASLQRLFPMVEVFPIGTSDIGI